MNRLRVCNNSTTGEGCFISRSSTGASTWPCFCVGFHKSTASGRGGGAWCGNIPLQKKTVPSFYGQLMSYTGDTNNAVVLAPTVVAAAAYGTSSDRRGEGLRV